MILTHSGDGDALGDKATISVSSVPFVLQSRLGRHKAPLARPGHHDYLTPGRAGYFAYSARGIPRRLLCSTGPWHVVVLNSMTQWSACPPPKTSPDDGRTCVGDAVQRLWLIADLERHRNRCTIAYFHHPRFSSGRHGSQYEMQQFWDILYAKGVDVVVSGHDHLYERFAPQDPEGNLDTRRGIRHFTVGTGGAGFYEFSTILPNSEVRINDTHGVLALALGNNRYAWSFIPVEGGTRDSGGGVCH